MRIILRRPDHYKRAGDANEMVVDMAAGIGRYKRLGFIKAWLRKGMANWRLKMNKADLVEAVNALEAEADGSVYVEFTFGAWTDD